MPLGFAVGDAGLAQLAEGDGVAAGLGEEVAPVAEHVGPPVQAERRGVRVLAQFPASRNEPLVVLAAMKGCDRGRAADGVVR